MNSGIEILGEKMDHILALRKGTHIIARPDSPVDDAVGAAKDQTNRRVANRRSVEKARDPSQESKSEATTISIEKVPSTAYKSTSKLHFKANLVPREPDVTPTVDASSELISDGHSAIVLNTAPSVDDRRTNLSLCRLR
jgi:hypothetical protein